MSDLIKPEFVEIDFYGDTLVAVSCDDGAHVSVRRICENLGIHLQTQLEKLKKAAWASCTAIRTTAADGKDYHTTMVPLKAVPMWLAGISEDRVASHVREKLVRYQLEAADVLAAHFMPAVVAAQSADLDSLDGLTVLASQLTTRLIAANQRAIAAETTVAEQSEVIAIASPKAEVFDAIVDSDGAEVFRAACKILKRRTGAKEEEVRSILFSRGYAQRLDGQLAPAFAGETRGFTCAVLRPYHDVEGNPKTRSEFRITPKGIAHIAKILLKGAA